MISFNKLGNLGRLGNQMFQYASLKGIALKNQYEFVIPPKEIFGKEDEKVLSDINSTIYDVFDITHKNCKITNFPILLEKTHSFDSTLFNLCPDNIDLMGYFQTEKYFSHIEDLIREDFSFKKEIKELCKKLFLDLNLTENSISLHVRRGDYVQLQDYHPLVSIEYYKNALSLMPNGLPILIFTDDVEWCKQQELFYEDRFLISENNQTGIDLCLMTMCKYHIIANSSLSWWGSWLAKSEKTIAPKNWFHEKTNNNCSDKYLKNWILI